MTQFLPVNVGELSRPATLLIEKVSNAIGRHFDPRQAIRMAEAEAKAERIRAVAQAETEIEVAELRRRAAERFVEEQMRMQSNMESIAAKAIPHLSDDAEPDRIEDDWISNFFDKSRIVSDENMQQLWGKVLAEEGNRPGSFSRKTVNLIADLDKRDAEQFTSLCRVSWTISGTLIPLVYDEGSSVYRQLGIDFHSVSQLEALGLVRFQVVGNFNATNLPQNVPASYGGRRVSLTLPRRDGNRLDVGKVLLTNSGGELLRITGAQVADGFFEYVYDRWASQSLVPQREVGLQATFNELADNWLAETAMQSNPAIIANHPAYPQIVGLGEQAIPLILAEISEARNRPHWFQVLHDITGVTRLPEEAWGSVEAVAAAWLEWERGASPLNAIVEP